MKPEWSTVLRLALDMEHEAERLRDVALGSLRCGETDSGGARCTADAHIPHDHRHYDGDLP